MSDAKLGSSYDDKFSGMELGKLRATVAEQAAEIERLRAALIKHGEHSEACASRDLSDRGVSFVRHDWPCDCGLRAALESGDERPDKRIE